jgi:hypothetical protein
MTVNLRSIPVTVVAVILCTFLAPGPGRGQPEARNAKVGDWVQYEEIAEAENQKARITVKITVKAVDKETGMVKSTVTEVNSRGETNFIRGVRPNLQLLLDADPKKAPGGWAKAEDVKETEESIKVGGKTYKCQRIDAKGSLPEGAGEWTRTVWATSELGFLGWVKCEATSKTKDFLPSKMTRQVLASGIKAK